MHIVVVVVVITDVVIEWTRWLRVGIIRVRLFCIPSGVSILVVPCVGDGWIRMYPLGTIQPPLQVVPGIGISCLDRVGNQPGRVPSHRGAFAMSGGESWSEIVRIEVIVII
jgi:hypothetical protein